MPQQARPEHTAGQAGQAAGRAGSQPAPGRDVFTGGLLLAPETRDEVSRLQAGLPGYDVVVTRHGHAWRFEAVRDSGGPPAGPWCVVSSDLAELRRELAPWMRPDARPRIVPGRAP
jgi:hypothetical protein